MLAFSLALVREPQAANPPRCHADTLAVAAFVPRAGAVIQDRLDLAAISTARLTRHTVNLDVGLEARMMLARVVGQSLVIDR